MVNDIRLHRDCEMPNSTHISIGWDSCTFLENDNISRNEVSSIDLVLLSVPNDSSLERDTCFELSA